MRNRILGIKAYRAKQGGLTRLEWAPLYVDDKDRRGRKPKNGQCKGAITPKPCACGGERSGYCIPGHHVHVGNELEDSLAKRGNV